METTESLKSKERALSDARKRAAELKNDAQLERARPIKLGRPSRVKTSGLREGQWLEVVEKYEDTIASLEAERAALDQKLRVSSRRRDKGPESALEGEGGFGAEDSNTQHSKRRSTG